MLLKYNEGVTAALFVLKSLFVFTFIRGGHTHWTHTHTPDGAGVTGVLFSHSAQVYKAKERDKEVIRLLWEHITVMLVNDIATWVWRFKGNFLPARWTLTPAFMNCTLTLGSLWRKCSHNSTLLEGKGAAWVKLARGPPCGCSLLVNTKFRWTWYHSAGT